jgi:hypothetical protein
MFVLLNIFGLNCIFDKIYYSVKGEFCTYSLYTVNQFLGNNGQCKRDMIRLLSIVKNNMK